MLSLLWLSVKTKEFDKNIVISDRQIYIAIAQATKRQLSQIMEQTIKRLVTSAILFCLGTLPYKYSCYVIFRYFALIIQKDNRKSYGLAYKVYWRKL